MFSRNTRGPTDKGTVGRNRIQSELQNVPSTYTGERKRATGEVEVSGAEHKPGTDGNVGSAVKQHAETTGHGIHPNYTGSLEPCMRRN